MKVLRAQSASNSHHAAASRRTALRASGRVVSSRIKPASAEPAQVLNANWTTKLAPLVTLPLAGCALAPAGGVLLPTAAELFVIASPIVIGALSLSGLVAFVSAARSALARRTLVLKTQERLGGADDFVKGRPDLQLRVLDDFERQLIEALNVLNAHRESALDRVAQIEETIEINQRWNSVSAAEMDLLKGKRNEFVLAAQRLFHKIGSIKNLLQTKVPQMRTKIEEYQIEFERKKAEAIQRAQARARARAILTDIDLADDKLLLQVQVDADQADWTMQQFSEMEADIKHGLSAAKEVELMTIDFDSDREVTALRNRNRKREDYERT